MTAFDGAMISGFVVAVAAAAFFAAAQAAYTRLTLVRAMKLPEEFGSRAQRAVQLMREPARTLNVIALLVVTARVTGVVLLTVVFTRHLPLGWATVAGALLGAGAMFVGAEVAPKTLALQHADRTVVTTARLVSVFAVVLAPLVNFMIWLGNLITPGSKMEAGPFVTEDDLRDMIDTAESDEVIEESERVMIHSIFELSDTLVREIMVPRPDMVAVPASAPLAQVLDVILECGHSRVPVYADDRDQIVGLIYAKDVLHRLRDGGDALNGPWEDLLRSPFFVPELKSVDELLRELQASKVHLAIVVDEYGTTAGLVTIEDIVEEIVGEIVDEYDLEDELVGQVPDHTLRVDARLPIDDLSELLGTELPSGEWDTVGGLLYGMLGHVPKVGDGVEVDGVKFVAEEVSGRRVSKVLVDRDESAAHEPA